ncbi:hypothetical protein DD594_25700, partial [Enterobacter cloacae complex sp. 4DZ1-17B1]
EPPRMSAQAWLEQKEMCDDGLPPGMKRLSLWYELPYWPRLMINHLLDPMHIFKNVGNLLWDHLTVKKDTLGARVDLRNVDRMEEYWPQTASDGSIKLPKAPWIFTGAQERKVKETIRSLRTPTGVMHSLRTCFTKEGNLTGLKSHDWHKICQVRS